MRKRMVFVLVFVIAIGLLMGCGGGGNKEPEDKQEAAGYKDGTFEGESEKDDRDTYGTVSITLADNKITEVDYEEITADGTPKGPDYPYQTSVESQAKYENSLIETQDIDKVDSVSGATSTWKKFVAATKAALEKAEK